MRIVIPGGIVLLFLAIIILVIIFAWPVVAFIGVATGTFIASAIGGVASGIVFDECSPFWISLLVGIACGIAVVTLCLQNIVAAIIGLLLGIAAAIAFLKAD